MNFYARILHRFFHEMVFHMWVCVENEKRCGSC